MITFLASEFVATFDADHVVPKPMGVAEGDLMLATTFVFDVEEVGYPNEVTSAPDGWSLEAHTDWEESVESHLRMYIRLYSKVAGPSEPSTYTFSLSNVDADSRGVQICAWTGNMAVPVEAVSSGVLNAADMPETELNLPSITTLGENRLLVVMGHKAAAFGFSTMLSPWVQRAQSVNRFAFDRQLGAAGEVGAQVVTQTTTMTRGAFMVALVPADAIPGYRFDCSTIDSQIN